jgi:hypothetical protein
VTEQRYDVVVKTYKSKISDTRHENVTFEQATGIASAVVTSVLGADPGDETGFSFMVRRAKETVYEVWRSADVGEIKETTFASLDNAKKYANDMQAQEDRRYTDRRRPCAAAYAERDGYYVMSRRGRSKPEIVYRAKRD